MFTKPKNAYSLTHTIIWDILYCYRIKGRPGPGRVVATIWKVRIRGAISPNRKTI